MVVDIGTVVSLTWENIGNPKVSYLKAMSKSSPTTFYISHTHINGISISIDVFGTWIFVNPLRENFL